MSPFPQWRVRLAAPGVVVAPDERCLAADAAMGLQHVIAMFGATVLAPLLMGFDPNVAILMSGIGTLIFFVVVGGQVPSYLGSTFAFIGVVIAATGFAGGGPTPTSAWRWAASWPAAVDALIGMVVLGLGTAGSSG